MRSLMPRLPRNLARSIRSAKPSCPMRTRKDGPISEPERFDYTPGRGITAAVDGTEVLVGNRPLMIDRGIELPTNLDRKIEAASEIFVAHDGRFLGEIVVADTVRPEAKRAVEALGRMRMRTILLTGDTKAVAAAVAHSVGISEFEANLLPEDKASAHQGPCVPWSGRCHGRRRH